MSPVVCSACGLRGTYRRLEEPWAIYVTPDGSGFVELCRECQDEEERAEELLEAGRQGSSVYLVFTDPGCSELRRVELEGLHKDPADPGGA